MKLHHLRNLLAIAKEGSMRAAARELDIAQPALTRSIQELEKELGVPLFERTARGVVSTAAGDAFIRRARSIDNELAKAIDEIAQLQGVAQGSVRIAMSMVPHMALLPYALQPFVERFPGVRLDIIDAVFPTAAAGLADRSIDFYIGPVPDKVPEGLLLEPLFENTRVIVARIGHPMAKAKSLAELEGAKWMSTSITAHPEHELGPLFAQHRLPPPQLVLQAHSFLTLSVALLNSDLLTMLPVQWAEFELTKTKLLTIAVKEHLVAPPICIIQRSGLPLTPAAEHFCDLARRAAAQLHLARAHGGPNG